ncbi:MAG: hypothetical protein CMH58_06070 [Myxococcales bacterium]|nr:hypothetical protein [Myxococcales bacterium]
MQLLNHGFRESEFGESRLREVRSTKGRCQRGKKFLQSFQRQGHQSKKWEFQYGITQILTCFGSALTDGQRLI